MAIPLRPGFLGDLMKEVVEAYVHARNAINHIPVTSSNIHTIGYDPDRRELHVTFKGSGTYLYHGVSPEAHQALMAADSKGTHLRKFIIPKHESMRMP